MGARPCALTMTVPATAMTVSTAGRTLAAAAAAPASGTEPRDDSSPTRLRVALFEDEGTKFLRERRPTPLAGGDDPDGVLADRRGVGRHADESALPCPVDAFDRDEVVGGVEGAFGDIGRHRLRFREATRDRVLARAGSWKAPFRDIVGDAYVRDVFVEYRLGSGARVSACTSPVPSGPMSRSTVVYAGPKITKC